MKKDTFLTAIQKDAHYGNGKRIWDHAIAIPENDKRWGFIYTESWGYDDLYRQYSKYFGLELTPKAPIKRKVSRVERYEKLIARATSEQEVEYLKKQLASAIELEKAMEKRNK